MIRARRTATRARPDYPTRHASLRRSNRPTRHRAVDLHAPTHPGPSPYARAAAAPSPAAARSASALSVRSHVKSWSSRPKWP